MYIGKECPTTANPYKRAIRRFEYAVCKDGRREKTESSSGTVQSVYLRNSARMIRR